LSSSHDDENEEKSPDAGDADLADAREERAEKGKRRERREGKGERRVEKEGRAEKDAVAEEAEGVDCPSAPQRADEGASAEGAGKEREASPDASVRFSTHHIKKYLKVAKHNARCQAAAYHSLNCTHFGKKETSSKKLFSGMIYPLCGLFMLMLE